MTNHFNAYHKHSSWPPIKRPDNQSVQSVKNTSTHSIPLDYVSLDKSLMYALRDRRTSKEIKRSHTLDLLKVGSLLKWSVGMFDEKRVFPSAGALYSIRCLIAINDCSGVKPGLYEYIPEYHSLEWLSQYQVVGEAFVQEAMDYNVCLLLGSDLSDANHQYGERGYRFSLLEAGHMMQNIMLVAASLDLAIAPIGGFNDDVANDLSAQNHFKTLYLVPVGD